MNYKGFNKDMTCRDFKYEEGKEYEEPKAEICESGFHSCEYPLDCLRYYSPSESVYHEVEVGGEASRSEEPEDTKVASTKIKIGAEIHIAGLVKAAIEYTTERIKKKSLQTKTTVHPRQGIQLLLPLLGGSIQRPKVFWDHI